MKTSTWTAAYAKVFVTALLAATLAHFISSTTSGDAAPVPAVTMTVPSGSTTTRSIQACGSALADLLKKVCRNGYNAPPPLSDRSDHRTPEYSRNDDDDGREKRAITRECCLHPCTLADLLQYCNIASSKNDLWPHHSVGGGGGGGGGCVVDGNTNTNASTTASVPTTSTRRGRTDTGLGLGVGVGVGVGATRINSPRRWPPEASTLPNTVDSNQWNVKAKPSGAIYFRQQNKPSSFTIAIAKAKANEKPQG